MTQKIRLHATVHFRCGRNGRKYLKLGQAPRVKTPQGRVPRAARLMALAIHFDRLIREGVIKDQAELARVGHVSRARVTQIMNLLCLAPDIQEELLFLPRVEQGRDPITEAAPAPVDRRGRLARAAAAVGSVETGFAGCPAAAVVAAICRTALVVSHQPCRSIVAPPPV
ncbi:hypothetical protein [Thermogutta sp.]|uniref:hypothetical protein n=1 Tax=Thermogutta sp. TaxID=1962930 RepID=UPI0025E5F675|nr:hypothetical protein [Thermogutta sp.]